MVKCWRFLFQPFWLMTCTFQSIMQILLYLDGYLRVCCKNWNSVQVLLPTVDKDTSWNVHVNVSMPIQVQLHGPKFSLLFMSLRNVMDVDLSAWGPGLRVRDLAVILGSWVGPVPVLFVVDIWVINQQMQDCSLSLSLSITFSLSLLSFAFFQIKIMHVLKETELYISL